MPNSPFPRIQRRGEFTLAIRPEEAFKLFTAAGERLWVPGWEPTILGSLPQHPGMVFLTGEGDDRTIWTVLESDPKNGRVRYSRVTPVSKAGTVAVEVTACPDGSKVSVVYDLTAIAPNDPAALNAYTIEGYASMMDQWRTLIEAMPPDARADLAELVA